MFTGVAGVISTKALSTLKKKTAIQNSPGKFIGITHSHQDETGSVFLYEAEM